MRDPSDQVAIHLWAGNELGVIDGPDDVFLAGAVMTASCVPGPSGSRVTRLEHSTVWKAGSGFAQMAATAGRG